MKHLAYAFALFFPTVALAGDLTVQPVALADRKPVFATVESTDVALARARIGGTLIDLLVDEGATVAAGQVVAVVGDEKLALQTNALDAQVAAATAQQVKAQDDLRRAQELFAKGTVAKARLDDAKAAFEVAENQLKALQAQRAVISQQVKEGQVLAPGAGRVLSVPYTKGSVVMPGEVVSRIAAESYILRLQLPERHADALKVGDQVQVGEGSAGKKGHLRQIYPEISNGRVTVDADVEGLGSYFVGQRVRVWITVSHHDGLVVPPAYLLTRSGIDYVRLKMADGVADVPVQRGAVQPDGTIEILSGIKSGDVLAEVTP